MLLKAIKKDLVHKAEWYGLDSSIKSVLRMCLSDGSTAQILYRLMHYCQTHKLKILSAVIYRLNASVGHAVIGRDAYFGKGFVILHSFGIVINKGVIAGDNVVLEHGVTIGAEKNLVPIIGNNVYIGAGAKIIGPVHIGNDVKIGANSVVVSDIPDGATAVGAPAKTVKIYGKSVKLTDKQDHDNGDPRSNRTYTSSHSGLVQSSTYSPPSQFSQELLYFDLEPEVNEEPIYELT